MQVEVYVEVVKAHDCRHGIEEEEDYSVNLLARSERVKKTVVIGANEGRPNGSLCMYSRRIESRQAGFSHYHTPHVRISYDASRVGHVGQRCRPAGFRPATPFNHLASN